jgi:hypothetical protein
MAAAGLLMVTVGVATGVTLPSSREHAAAAPASTSTASVRLSMLNIVSA